MNNANLHHSPAWVVFTYVSFAAALAMVIVGISLMLLVSDSRAVLIARRCQPSPRFRLRGPRTLKLP